jgi:hypothetical protein
MDSLPSTNTPGPAQINAALLILRIASALVFLYHGSQILFGAFGGPGPQGFSAFMHMPVVVGYLVGAGTVCRRLGDPEWRSDSTWRNVHHCGHARSYLLGAPAARF